MKYVFRSKLQIIFIGNSRDSCQAFLDIPLVDILAPLPDLLLATFPKKSAERVEFVLEAFVKLFLLFRTLLQSNFWKDSNSSNRDDRITRSYVGWSRQRRMLDK